MDKQINTNTITVNKVVGPTIEALASDYKGKVKVAKLDVDSSPEGPGRDTFQKAITYLWLVFEIGKTPPVEGRR